MLNGFMSFQFRRQHRTPSETILGMTYPRLNSYLLSDGTKEIGPVYGSLAALRGTFSVFTCILARSLGIWFSSPACTTARVLFSSPHTHLGDVVTHNNLLGEVLRTTEQQPIDDIDTFALSPG